MTIIIMALSTMTFTIMYTQHNDIYHNDTKYNDNYHNDTHHNDIYHIDTKYHDTYDAQLDKL